MSIDALLSLDDSRLRRAAAKLTHVGEQTGPVSTIVVQVYYYLPSLEKFRVWQMPGVFYGNDELPIILNFSVTPQEFRQILGAAKRVWDSLKQLERPTPSLSFSAMVEAPEGIDGTELHFTYGGAVALHQALAGAIDQDNKIGQMILQRQRESAYAGT